MDMPTRQVAYPYQNPRVQQTTQVSQTDMEYEAPSNYWKVTGQTTDKTIILTGAAQLEPHMNQQ